MTGRLHPDDVELIARRVVELQALRPARPALVDAATLAREIGMRAWVYEHRDELGAVQVGDGEKPRLRFNLERALAGFDVLTEKPRATAPARQAPRSRRRDGDSTVPLLPIAGEKAA